MEYKHRPLNEKMKAEIVKESVRLRKLEEGYDEFTCPYCSRGLMIAHEEGIVCHSCLQITNLCEECGHWMNLLNWGPYPVTDTEPPANVGKPFTPWKSSWGAWYIDDRSFFYWKCEKCNYETASHCD